MVPHQYFKKLTGTENLWEVRTQMSGNSYRLLGFFDGAALLILTSGFSKKQRETPDREIRTAQQRRLDYLQRRDDK
jgi:phage-related protein